MPPGLEADVGAAEAGVGEAEVDLDVELVIVGEVAVLGQCQELATGDQGSFDA